jgi:hypothetical protein
LVIDTEGGTDHYAKFFKFFREKTSDPNEIKRIIEELIDDPQGIKTLIIDPFTVVYDTILAQHESRLKAKSGNANYTLQPTDYKYIKAVVKNLILKLLALDMNIIVTARSATDYSKEEFMKVLGTKAEGPKELPYLFDVVLELTTGPNGTFIAQAKKDRTNMLPKEPFEFSYKAFTEYLGIDGLTREPVVFTQKSNLNKNSGRTTTTKFNGNDVKTAGITGTVLEKIEKLVPAFGTEELQQKIREEYCVDSVLDLKNDEGELLVKDMEQILSVQNKK